MLDVSKWHSQFVLVFIIFYTNALKTSMFIWHEVLSFPCSHPQCYSTKGIRRLTCIRKPSLNFCIYISTFEELKSRGFFVISKWHMGL